MTEENRADVAALPPTPCSAWVYHYTGISQIEPGSINYIDGVAERSHKITTFEDYQFLKHGIADEAGVSSKALTLISLSLIHWPNSK